jgi:hypothetical protein
LKKLIFAVVFMLFLTSCTSDNSKKPMICRSIGFDSAENGGIFVTVLFSDTGDNTETGNKNIIKSYTSKNADEAVDTLLSAMNDAMFKPAESMFIGKSLDAQSKNQLIGKIVNTAELQLKCRVCECENASVPVRSGKKAPESSPVFTEYFRIRTSADKEK